MNKRNRGQADSRQAQWGFSLIELLVTVIILAVLTAIAVPVYSSYVGRTRRVAAEGCLMQASNFMERFYTTNLTYLDPATNAGPTSALALDCMGTSQTGKDYKYSFSAATVSTYKIQAVPAGTQATRDSKCATVSIDQTGTRFASGTSGVAGCW